MATLKAIGTCRFMPSLRLISTWRRAQDTKAPTAQIVMTCHSPPSFKGAKPKP